MARTVDYLPFSTNVGANVEGQSSYVIDPIRLTGHQAGVAKSAVVNKSLRQHSVMVAALANLLSEALDVDVLDDGDVEALKQMLADVLMGGRSTILTRSATLYVRSTGSDLNDGLTPSTAFATPQGAINHAYSTYQLNGQQLVIDIGNGTFGSIGLGGPLVGQLSTYGLVIIGAGKGSTTLASPGQSINMNGLAAATIAHMRFTCMGRTQWGDGCGIMMHNSCSAWLMDIDYGPMQTGGEAFGNHNHVAYGSILSMGDLESDQFYTISGGGNSHYLSAYGSLISTWNIHATLTGTPNFASSFATCWGNSSIAINSRIPPGTALATFSGAATGTRFAVDGMSSISTIYRNVDTNFFPGSLAGSWVNNNVQWNYA